MPFNAHLPCVKDYIGIEQERLRGSSQSACRRSTLVKLTKTIHTSGTPKSREPPRLTHLTSDGSAHMVDVGHKKSTLRSATAASTLLFSDPVTFEALSTASVQKGDAIAVARIAGIQAAKKTADLIPLAHPGLGITKVVVDINAFAPPSDLPDHVDTDNLSGNGNHGGVQITATVDCDGKTGVEMEALTAATVASLTMYDMLKGVDKGMQITGARVIAKRGGASGSWRWSEETGKVVKVSDSVPATPVQPETTTPSDDESAQTVFDAEWRTFSNAFNNDDTNSAHEKRNP